MKISLFVLACAAIVLCAPTSAQTTPSSSSLAPSHSVPPTTSAPASSAPAEAFRVVPEDQTKQWWIPVFKENSAPSYPKSAMESGIQGCVALAFAIHADGTTTPLQVIKNYWTVYNPSLNKLLQQLAITSTTHLQFVPAPQNSARAPLLTYAITTYTLSGSGEDVTTTDMRKRCAVSDFASDMQKLFASPVSSSNSP